MPGEPTGTTFYGRAAMGDTSEYVVTIDQDLNYTFLLSEETADALPPGTDPTPVEQPVISALVPDTAEVGAPEFTLSIQGTGFSPISTVLWNGGQAPTVFVSDLTLSIQVDPGTASGPWTIPVVVQTSTAISDPADFSFTEPEPPEIEE
jgi:hypothetical protein